MTMNAIGASLAASNGAADAAGQTAGQSEADKLGQKDFLTLLTAQLQNQDPFAPMENGDFLGQMAQFSTVSGIEGLNDSIKALGDRMSGDRLSRASSMIGKGVLVEGSTVRADDEGAIHGAVDLPDRASDVRVRFLDPASGVMVHEMKLGPQPAGKATFAWADVPDEIASSRSSLRVSIEADLPTGTRALGASVYARVTGVEMPPGTDDITVRAEDYGLLSSLEITALR